MTKPTKAHRHGSLHISVCRQARPGLVWWLFLGAGLPGGTSSAFRVIFWARISAPVPATPTAFQLWGGKTCFLALGRNPELAIISLHLTRKYRPLLAAQEVGKRPGCNSCHVIGGQTYLAVSPEILLHQDVCPKETEKD